MAGSMQTMGKRIGVSNSTIEPDRLWIAEN
jgi:hypothetical protein